MTRLVVTPVLIVWLCCAPLSYGAYNKQDTPQLYEQALIDLNNGDSASAEIQLKNALQADPAFLAGHVLLGQTYLDQGRPALAQKQFETGLQLGADPTLILEPLAEALLAQKKFYPLLDVIYPGNYSATFNARLLVNRGRAYFELAQYDQAELAFRDAANTDPGNLAALLGQARIHLAYRDFIKSQSLANQAQATDPDNPEVWYLQGSIAHAQNRFQQAITLFTKALELNAGHYQSKLSRIGIYVDTGQNQLALDELIALHELAPYDPQAAYMLSVAYSRMGNNELAKTALGKARDVLESMPAEVTQAHGPTLLLSGIIYFDLQEWQKAAAQLERYQRAYPSAPSIGKLLGSIYLELNNLPKSIDSFEKARQTQAGDPQLLTLLGNAYLKKQDYFRASTAFQEALKIVPDSPEAGKGLGLSQLGMGDIQQGVEALHLTTQQASKASEAGVILVITLLREQRYPEAIAIAEGELQKAPDNLILKNLLASTYIAVGKHSQARLMYQQLVDLDPRFLPAQINLAKLDRIENKLDQALSRLNALLLEHPKNTLLMLEMARVYEQQGQAQQTTLWLEKAHAIDAHDTAVGSYLVSSYLRGGAPKKALELGRQLASANLDNWQATYALAEALIENSEQTSAQSTLKQLSLLAGYDAKQLISTATLQLQAQDPSSAIYTLSKALKVKPDDISTRTLYASLLLQLQRLEELELELDYLNNLDANHPSILVLRADVLASQGKFSAALSHYQQAIDQRPESAIALKIHRLFLTTQQPGESMRFLQQWSQRFPQDLAVADVLAQGYLYSGQYDLARQGFEKILAQGGRSASILNNLASLYLKNKDPRALSLAQEAHRLNPDSPAINDTLGWILVSQGELDTGLQHLRNASVRSANNPEILYHIAAVLVRLNRLSEAKRILEKALAMNVLFDSIEPAKALQRQLITNTAN